MESGELLATFTGHTAAVRGIAFHGNGSEVFSAGTDGRLMRWKVDGGAKVAEMPCGGEVNRIQLAAGSVLVSSADRKLRHFSSETNQVLRTFEGAEDWILTVAVNPGVTHVAAGGFDGKIRVWDVATGAEVWNRTAEPDQAAGKSETVVRN